MKSDAGILQEKLSLGKNKNAARYFQLWLCAPAITKKENDHFKDLDRIKIPLVNLSEDAGKIRVIAGNFQKTIGPIQTFKSMNLWDMRLNANKKIKFQVKENQTAIIYVLQGEITLNKNKKIEEAELGVLEREGKSFTIQTNAHTKMVYISGDSINEPMTGYGKIHLNSMEEMLKIMDHLKNK